MPAKASRITLKRVYDSPAASDGVRVLVDRLWPRGLKREDAHIDHWFKTIAPSAELRAWFAHDPAKWPEFQRRYRHELQGLREELKPLEALAKVATTAKPLTLLFAARDEAHNNAVVLRSFLE